MKSKILLITEHSGLITFRGEQSAVKHSARLTNEYCAENKYPRIPNLADASSSASESSFEINQLFCNAHEFVAIIIKLLLVSWILNTPTRKHVFCINHRDFPKH